LISVAATPSTQAWTLQDRADVRVLAVGHPVLDGVVVAEQLVDVVGAEDGDERRVQRLLLVAEVRPRQRRELAEQGAGPCEVACLD
jgi:hypothetical protein